MTKVRKRSGELEEFDRRKVEESIGRTGAPDDVAKRIAERVAPAEGAPTTKIRERVVEELRREKPDLAESYSRTVRLKARVMPDIPAGKMKVPELMPRFPELKSDLPARVEHGNKVTQVRIEPSLKTREVGMNREDLQRLGAQDGARVAVHIPRPPAPMPPAAGTQPR